jgi:hypothetical protein
MIMIMTEQKPTHYNFIIPYRDRPICLRTIIKQLPKYLAKQPYIKSFRIVVVEQEPGKLFNLAKIINVGFTIVKTYFPYDMEDCFIFHPVDAIPIEGSYFVPEESFVTFCSDHEDITTIEKPYGKAHGFRNNVFETINGYSNEYWGWGQEDDDMFIRLEATKAKTFGTFIKFDFLMNSIGENHRIDCDPQNANTLNWKQNSRLLMEMKQHKNYMLSGLNTLDYTILEHFQHKNEPDIYHFKVSI